MSAPDHDRDEGAVLPMVLAFIMVIGVVVGAILGQASAQFTATVALRDHRDRVYAADAGLERALVLQSHTCNLSLTVNGAAVTVTCSGTPEAFTVTSTAVKGPSSSVATAVIVKTTSGNFVPREWRTALG